MENNPVVVVADPMGSVIGISDNNSEYGYIRVQQVAKRIGNGGWFSWIKKSALLKGKIEDLKEANFKEGDILPGKIVIKESLSPFYAEDPDKHLKRAGDSGVVCTLDDQPIYRDSIYTTNMEDEDELIQHNNGEIIKREMMERKEAINSESGISNLVQNFRNSTNKE